MRCLRVVFTCALISTSALLWAGDSSVPPPPVEEASAGVAAVLVELDGRSAVEASRIGTNAAAAQIALAEAAQRDFLRTLASEAIDAREIYRVQRVLNGVAIEVQRADVARIERLPGVKRVHQLRSARPDLAGSLPLIGVPPAWSMVAAGVTGRGVRIGIIDSGIDYHHMTFGGDGIYAAGENFADSIVPWNAKVAGGVDLAGDDYDSGSESEARRTPHPDGDPMDCMGHGTAVASVAGGYGVQNNAPYRGTYDSNLHLDTMALAPGVAPEAELYAIRVFGCSGVTRLVAPALEWSVDPNGDGDFSDHLDIVNLSIGTDFFLGEAEEIAADAAAAAGVVVIGSAGNSGDTYFIADGAGAATRAISVANSRNQRYRLDGFRIDAPASAAGVYPAQTSSAFSWTPMTPVSGEVARPAAQTTGCSAFTASDAALLSGNIALLDWTEGGCGTATRTNNAAAAGAIGVIFIHDEALLGTSGITGNAQIPAIRTTQEVGAMMKPLAGAGLRATLAGTWLGTQTIDYASQADVISPDSSRGPRIGDALLKPDLSAPGGPVFGARVRSGTLGQLGGGTSIAAPHVAGAAALLRQRHPSWTVEEIKAALINTTTPDVYSSADHAQPKSGTGRIGAGRLDVAFAAEIDTLAMAEAPAGAVNVSFGVIEVGADTRADARFRIVNKSNAAKTLTLAYAPALDVPGIAFSFPGGTTVTVPAQSSVISTIRMTATAAAVSPVRDPSVPATINGLARYWITEAGGHIVLSPATGAPFRLPVYAVIRPVGFRRAAQQLLDPGPSAQRVFLGLTGSEVANAAATPLLMAFEWHHASGEDIPSLRMFRAGDIRYAGAASDAKALVSASATIDDATVAFAIATHGRWCTPNLTNINVSIDVDADGTEDYLLYTTAATPADTLRLAVCPRPTGTCFWNTMARNVYRPTQYETAPFFSDAVVLPVRAKDIGLGATKTRFAYRVTAFVPWQDDWHIADRTEWLTFDIAHPAVSFVGGAVGSVYIDRGEVVMPFDYDPSAVATSSFRGILLLHLHNGRGMRAEVVPFAGATEGKSRGVRH